MFIKDKQRGYAILEGLIRSRTARKILTIFVANPDDKFYIRQLERLIKEPVSAVRRELLKLEKSGFLLSKQEAPVSYYCELARATAEEMFASRNTQNLILDTE